jgi:hypothetical protein
MSRRANTGLGRLDVALDLAATNHWTVVDMKRDWKVMFPFQKQWTAAVSRNLTSVVICCVTVRSFIYVKICGQKYVG